MNFVREAGITAPSIWRNIMRLPNNVLASPLARIIGIDGKISPLQ